MADWSVQLETEPDLEMRQKVLAPLIAYNEHVGGPGRFAPLAVTERDACGEVVGGLWGYSQYEFLFVEMLALVPV